MSGRAKIFLESSWHFTIAFGFDHIKMIRVLRGNDGDTLQVHVLMCVTVHLPFPLPGVVGVSRLYWGVEGVGIPDWLVPIANG